MKTKQMDDGRKEDELIHALRKDFIIRFPHSLSILKFYIDSQDNSNATFDIYTDQITY
jgi:hypothetical protein